MNQSFLLSATLKEDQSLDFQSYPFSIPAIQNLDILKFDPKVTFLIGENGSGKSTLIEGIAISMGFNAEGGSKNFHFASRSTHSDLHQHLRVAKGTLRPRDGYFLRAESFYNVATEIDALGVADAYGGESLHRQSHGESFLSLIMNRFRGNGLYILDEPEAALSPARQLACLRVIHELVNKGSQFLIATHSPILMAYPMATIYMLDEEGIKPIRYEDTDHYQVSRMFFDRREQMLRDLFQE